MKSKYVAGISALIVTAVLASGITANALPASRFPELTLTEGQLDSDGFPISGAKLCVSGMQGVCYQMPSETYSGSKVTYEFGLEPQAERLPLAGGGSWVFFSATFSGGGSGTLTRFAVLRYEGEGKTAKIVNLLPWVGATNVSEWAMWTVKGASAYPIFVHADFVWGKGETHFDSHFYTVEAWGFNQQSDRYEKVFEYQTSRKYGAGDGPPIRVLRPERAEIIRLLKTK